MMRDSAGCGIYRRNLCGFIVQHSPVSAQIRCKLFSPRFQTDALQLELEKEATHEQVLR